MTKFEALQNIFEIENIKARLEAYSKTISYDMLLVTVSKTEYSLLELGASSTTVTRTLKKLWPDRPVNSGKLCNYLFGQYGFKYCSNCHLVKEVEEFSHNKASNTGRSSHCRYCELDTRREYQKFYQAGMRAKKLSRTPSWSQTELIQAFYNKCPIGYHVDHIIPLQGKLISGLHVIENLQYLTAEENLKKQNKFNIDC